MWGQVFFCNSFIKENSLFLLKRIMTLVMHTLMNVAIIHLGVTNNSSSHLFIRDASLSFSKTHHHNVVHVTSNMAPHYLLLSFFILRHLPHSYNSQGVFFAFPLSNPCLLCWSTLDLLHWSWFLCMVKLTLSLLD